MTEQKEALVDLLYARASAAEDSCRTDDADVFIAAAKALTALQPPVAVPGELVELLRMWRNLVIEGGVPRYTVLPGAALNTLVGWTDAALTSTPVDETKL